ncbi:MAG: alpha/beta hydrolase [Bifidobacteriaceae bacterium]|jgi:pimeloyl-ACP methyl ester carboxylesterase|nr:alpha/beta hydrolase [Bifidobacteriaceae bacterium]
MAMLAARGAGALKGAVPLDQPKRDAWTQDDETARLSARDRREEAQAGPLVPPGVTPLVLLHAFPLSSLMWGPFADNLPDVPIIEVDLPGAGLSPVVEPVSIRGAAVAVAATLRELGVSRAVVGGISMGGYVAMRLLVEAPGLFAGLALMSTRAGPDTPEQRAGRLATAREVLAQDSVDTLRPMASRLVSAESAAHQVGLVPQLETWIAEASPAGVAWAQEAMASRPDSLPELRASGVPAAVLAGEEDPFSRVEDAEEMVEAIGPGASLTVFAGVAHLAPLEAPAPVARTVREFYRRAVATR